MIEKIKNLKLFGKKVEKLKILKESIFVLMRKIQENMLKEFVMHLNKESMQIVSFDMNFILTICHL